jgi:hypothetical protein
MKRSIVALCLLALGLSKAGAWERPPFTGLPIISIVVFGTDGRASFDDFAAHAQLDAADLRRRFASTGIVRCGHAHGSGQLTLADDVITTAAHVLYDQEGHLRGDSAHCQFLVQAAGQEIATDLDVAGAIVGSTNPYAESAVHDWAVVKLARPLREATPYPLTTPAAASPVLFVARGAIDWGQGRETSMQSCRLRDGLEQGAEGTREIAFDCSTNVGASGAGLLDGEGRGLMAIFVGYRSVAPDQALPFSATHYNFAVTVEGAFRRAVERQAALGATAEVR